MLGTPLYDVLCGACSFAFDFVQSRKQENRSAILGSLRSSRVCLPLKYNGRHQRFCVKVGGVVHSRFWYVAGSCWTHAFLISNSCAQFWKVSKGPRSVDFSLYERTGGKYPKDASVVARVKIFVARDLAAQKIHVTNAYTGIFGQGSVFV